jgi:hypothetical protein
MYDGNHGKVKFPAIHLMCKYLIIIQIKNAFYETI